MSRLVRIQKDILKTCLDDLSFNCKANEGGLLQAVYRIEAFIRAQDAHLLSRVLTDYDISVEISGRGRSLNNETVIEELIFLLACRSYRHLDAMEIAVKVVSDIEVDFTKDQLRLLFRGLDERLKKAIKIYLIRTIGVEDKILDKSLSKFIKAEDFIKDWLDLC